MYVHNTKVAIFLKGTEPKRDMTSDGLLCCATRNKTGGRVGKHLN